MTITERLQHAYKRMSSFYRPGAPSDGFGNITRPLADLNLDVEAAEYVARYLAEEDTGQFWVGYANYAERAALMLTIESARLVVAGERSKAARLLRVVADELDPQPDR